MRAEDLPAFFDALEAWTNERPLPFEAVRYGPTYAQRARHAGDEYRVTEVEGEHFEPIDPRSGVRPFVLAGLAEVAVSAGRVTA